MANDKKIVITGVGAVTSLGTSSSETFRRLCNGDNGIVEVPSLKESGFPVYIGGLVPEIESLLDIYPDARKYGSRKLAYILKSADEAMEQAGFENFRGMACGLYLGVETSRVAFSSTYEIFKRSGGNADCLDYSKYGSKCRSLVPSPEIHNKLPSFLPRYLSQRYEISGPQMATSNACASSNYAIGEAIRKLRSGRVDIAITGSADEMIDEYIVTGFGILRALSQNNAEPHLAMKPFDARRDGFVLGEGGAILVLETLEHALKRGANVICELAGFASSSDGEKITACNRKGLWLGKAMALAIEDGGMELDDINYVNAHGTSTRLNDQSESRAIVATFGDRAVEILVNSTKSMIGHSVASAGAIEAVVTALSISQGICHPTRNLVAPDTGCDLNYCKDKAVKVDIEGAISNSCGFSGGNSCITFRKYHD